MDKERLFRNLERKYCSKCELTVNLPLGVDTDEIWQEILQDRRSKGIRLPLNNICGEAYWYSAMRLPPNIILTLLPLPLTVIVLELY